MDLFSAIEPYSSGFLIADDIHQIYWEQSGNPDGVPIVFLHGGPGAGASPAHRRFFDPDHYRIIIFDQRGCGRSQPLGELKNNTTALLLSDIEALRKRLNIERWHIFGGSWGSTLAMEYAIAHPQKVLSLILRGIFLFDQSEVDWFLNGMSTIFPEAWEQFSGLLNEHEQKDLLGSYYKRLTDENRDVQIEAAVRWSLYEGACACLRPNYETITTNEQKDYALALARLEAHYFLNEVIPAERSLLSRISALRSIPAAIIQGRYDVICPIVSAYKLHQAWPEADYIVVPDAGHSALDPPLRSRLIEITELFKAIKP
ncbi:MAG: prolyl aminopeptidase [Micavibrio sp.]|nr:prolyl aminopeptidase [Micavibrio sp.]